MTIIQTCRRCSFPIDTVSEPATLPHILPHLTRSNDIPQINEVEFIKAAIADDEATDLEIRRSLRALEALREKLEERSQAVKKRIREYEAVLSPWRKTPEDILAQIFLLCFDQREKSSIPKSQAPIPWLLGHVCSRWRAVTQAIPHLWVNLPRFIYSEESNPKHLSVLTSAIRLSGDILPLNMSLTISSPLIDWTHPSLEALQPILSRVNRLSLAAPYRSIPSLSAARPTFEALTILQLDIDFGLDFDSGAPLVPLELFPNAPLLREVHLSSEDYNYPRLPLDQRLILPWSNLTRFVGIDLCANSIFVVLRHATLLEQLECSLKLHNDFSHNTQPTILHTKLRQFTLSGAEQWLMQRILQLLTFPSIIELSFRYCTYGISQQSFSDFITRSGCSLIILDLGNIPLSRTGLSWWSLFSQLEALHELYIPDDGTFWTSLSQMAGDGFPLLPNLKRLSVSGLTVHSFYYAGEINNLVRSRCLNESKPVTPLEGLSLQFQCENLTEVLERFHRVLELGEKDHISSHIYFQLLREWRHGAEHMLSNKEIPEDSNLLKLISQLVDLDSDAKNHLCCIRESGILRPARQLYEKLPVDEQQGVLAMILKKWERSVEDRLYSYGWMRSRDDSPPFPGLLYAKRQGSTFLDTPHIHPFIQRVLANNDRMPLRW